MKKTKVLRAAVKQPCHYFQNEKNSKIESPCLMFGLSVCLSRKVYSVTHWAKISFNFFFFLIVSSNHGVKRKAS